MDNLSSFICEHTSEYILVPRLTDFLKQKFEFVIPVFPWITRECGNHSNKIHSNDKFRVIGLYPRRPKFSKDDEKIHIKINGELVTCAEEALKNKIPIIAGCPLVRNFWELGERANCVWLKLDEKTLPFYELDNKKEASIGYKTQGKEKFLNSNDDILDFVIANGEELSMTDFLRVIRVIRYEAGNSGYFMGGYKPVYFLLKNSNIKNSYKS